MNDAPLCVRCGRAVVRNRDSYDLFEKMHWSCFHYEFEHEGDPDVACPDLACPARPVDTEAGPPGWALDDQPKL